MRVLLLCFLAVAAFAANPITITWADCGTSGTHSKVTDMKWSPASPKTGDNITLTGTGTLDEDVAGSTYTLTISHSGVPIVHHSHDGCSPDSLVLPLNLGKVVLPGLKCPVAKGTVTLIQYIEVSPLAPSGGTVAKFTAVDKAGAPLMCVDITFKT
eukprot:NODE_975_length_640_cov_128.062606_g903_i0.p1 GENE.NODE_975_length_640_cov_128.062606_g903_i0~~NODE_975_length_640_cov_128.062606_g903_i0.p1  ORF type:complete len:156 (-),score=34.72 NODE_975_length_640_cov_128.062606_g903_i0:113-580(-)